MTRGKKRHWLFDEQERALLWEATTSLPELRAVLERAQQRSDLGGRWLVQSNVAELDEMYSLVEALMGAHASGSSFSMACAPACATGSDVAAHQLIAGSAGRLPAASC